MPSTESSYAALKRRIETGEAVVAIIGLGYIGLPLAWALHQGGLRILGLDVDDDKIDRLMDGRGYLRHLGADLFRRLAASDRFSATSDFGRLSEADAVVVCVPTPLDARREPDLTFVRRAARQIGDGLRPGQLIVLESTTYPGTTREVFHPAIAAAAAERGGLLECGRDYFVAYSPEREDPGRKTHTVGTIPKLVGGLDESSALLAVALYERGVSRVIRVGSCEVAEAAKLLENVFRAVNIALVNELKSILTAMSIDVWEVIEAAATKPFGFMPFYPGPGLGGHCIPIDPFYLAWRARQCGHVTRFIELAGEINQGMPERVVERVSDALGEEGKPLRGSAILVLGLAYKPDVDDTRETPAAEIMSLLLERGAEVCYHDPHVPTFPRMRGYSLQTNSVPLSRETLGAADCVVLVTDHSAVDLELVGSCSRLVVDTRNALARVPSPRARIVKA